MIEIPNEYFNHILDQWILEVQVRQLICELGNTKWEIREAAQKALENESRNIDNLLLQGLESKDPEIIDRIRKIFNMKARLYENIQSE
jgi:hypothetical protein